MSLSTRVLVVFVLLLLLGEVKAFAYLDPGTGSLFVQGLIATLAAVAYALRLYWSRLRGLFGGAAGDTNPSGDPPLKDR